MLFQQQPRSRRIHPEKQSCLSSETFKLVGVARSHRSQPCENHIFRQHHLPPCKTSWFGDLFKPPPFRSAATRSPQSGAPQGPADLAKQVLSRGVGGCWGPSKMNQASQFSSIVLCSLSQCWPNIRATVKMTAVCYAMLCRPVSFGWKFRHLHGS